MIRDAMKKLLNRQPFEPLCVKLSNGQEFPIKHPEMAALAKNGLIITSPEPDGSPSDHFEICSYLHIAGVETETHTA